MRVGILSLVLASSVLMTLTSEHGLAAPRQKPSVSLTATGSGKVPRTVVTHGTIVSIGEKKLVLSVKNGKTGKIEQLSFVRSPETATSGALTEGKKVTLHYRREGADLLATSIAGPAPSKSEKAKEAQKE